MKAFLERFGDKITGILSGFDRLRLRGTKRLLAHVSGFKYFLWQSRVLLTHFDSYVKGRTAALCDAVKTMAEQAGRPVIYVASGNQDKATLVREQFERQGVADGLIGAGAVSNPVRPMSYTAIARPANSKSGSAPTNACTIITTISIRSSA